MSACWKEEKNYYEEGKVHTVLETPSLLPCSWDLGKLIWRVFFYPNLP